MRIVATGLVLALGLGLAACGGEPSDRVAVPGAPAGGDTRPTVSSVASSSSTTLGPSTTAVEPTTTATTTITTSTTSTTVDLTTSVAPATTVATGSSTTVAPPATPPATPTTTAVATTTTELIYSPEAADGPLRIGVEGPRSLMVQQQLIALAILPSTAADSKYGPGTAAGVRRFQESKGLIVDGVAGPNTVAALAAAVAALDPPAT